MKIVLLLAAVMALTLGENVTKWHPVKTKPADKDTFVQQYIIMIFGLFYNANQPIESEPAIIGNSHSIRANIEEYAETADKKPLENFLMMYENRLLEKYNVFSIFNDQHREQAISLFKIFFYAKDFGTFYKMAAWARIHLNEGMFMYSFYLALVQREDCSKFILPAPYEIYPDLFFNKYEKLRMHRIKQQGGLEFPEMAKLFGIVEENGNFVFYTNYSDSLTYPNTEQRLSYFTEDVELNSYYYNFHTTLPFWWNGNKFSFLKERRGEFYFFFYQQLLARYYLERLSNGLGEIPQFSWYSPISTGYYPFLSSWKYPFAQRSNNFLVHREKNLEAVRFLDSYEKTFLQFLQTGHFKAFNKTIDFHDPEAINFVGDYWQTNADLFGEEFTQTYQRSYEMTARRILGAAPEPFNMYEFTPSALDFYQTSLRDPVFYQMYNRIIDYIVQYKNYLKSYNDDDLHFVGVKINNVKVDKLITYFDLYDYEGNHAIYLSEKEDEPDTGNKPKDYIIRQPHLNHKPFTVSINIKSDVATDAAIKIWIGPKYDSNGFPIKFEKNWMNFFELDWFTHKLIPGENEIKRKSEDFLFFKDDSLPMTAVTNLFAGRTEPKLIPKDMNEAYDSMPERLMLPKGTPGGFPYQIFVFVFPYNAVDKDFNNKYMKIEALLDNKPFGYPLDRPVVEQYFKQPNMFFEDIMIYHEGEMHTYKMASPEWIKDKQSNEK